MRLLIVGSLAAELGQAARLAMARGARIEQADSAAAGLARLRTDARIDVVLCDVRHDIGALLRALALERIATPVVACGVDTDAETAIRAVRDGAREFLPLPPDADLIAAILEAASGEGHGLIVQDPVMRAVIRRAEQVAVSEASVLISGESGTGKEVIARHIHRRSKRMSGPFVALNCAAIPENLLESELFGHEKGAFSGAVARRVGKFEAADGGTLLLDEISEMDLRLQAKLLRALQEREIDRLGGGSPVRVNVRILATTNRELAGEVARGTFREDLYFRLNVVSLRMPPLRERPGDIPKLAAHFARKYAELNGVGHRAVGAEAEALLCRHHWRGNVRELENIVHRAVLLAVGAEIGAEALELTQDPSAAAAASSAASSAGAGTSGFIGRRMDEVERDLIIGTLGHTLGNRTHAATILGISIRALRNKLHEYTAQGVRVPPPPGAQSAGLQAAGLQAAGLQAAGLQAAGVATCAPALARLG